MRNLYLFFILSIALASCNLEKPTKWVLNSPDGGTSVQVNLDEITGRLSYQVTYLGKQAIESSSLGFSFEEADFADKLNFVSASEPVVIDEKYSMSSGKQKEYHNYANEFSVTFNNASEENISVVFRAYNNGVAFKYELAENPQSKTYTLKEELTSFNLPDQGKAWMHAYDSIVWWAPGYETYYEEVAIGAPAPENKNGWAFPLLFEVEDQYTLITEANVYGNYAAMHLDADCKGGNYNVTKPVFNEAYDMCVAEPTVTLPFESPWRVITLAGDLAGIVESNLVTHVSEPNKLNDISWIKPGLASWSWWSDEASCTDYGKLKEFVDFAAEMGWEYSLVDANWDKMEGGDLQKLAAYATSKNVGLMAWYNSGGPNNVVTEGPRDLMQDRDIRRAEFKKLQEWGVKGIKVDFFQSDKPCIIQQYTDILEDAAEFEILVNFHGCTLPKGWRRTYPNLMTMEAVKGEEAYRFASDFPDYGLVHTTIFPFSRNVVGPVDYTVAGLSDRKYPHLSRYGLELALPVVIESGIQHFCDDYRVYQALPGFAIDYLKTLPTSWDETKLLDGYPGEYVVMARKYSDTWYIAGINALDKMQDVELDLSFIDGTNDHISLIEDGDTREALKHRFIEGNGNNSLKLSMKSRGGFVAIIK